MPWKTNTCLRQIENGRWSNVWVEPQRIAQESDQLLLQLFRCHHVALVADDHYMIILIGLLQGSVGILSGREGFSVLEEVHRYVCSVPGVEP